MKIDYKEIHKSLLLKSSNFYELKKQISNNGLISLSKPKMDFFSYVVKTIISQQISNSLANSIWKKFCSYFEKNEPKLEKIEHIDCLKFSLENLGISKKKKEYILNFYKTIMLGSINFNLLKVKDENEFKKQLINLKGIGNWSCDMILIFFLRRTNIFPKNDLIIEKVKKKLCLIEKRKINFSKIYSPYLSILSLHMRKMYERIFQEE